MKKNMNLFLIVFVIFVLAGCSNNNTNNTENLESKKNSYTQINMEEAVKMMEEESDYIILDVRRPDEFAEKHILNAINVPNENIGNDDIPELPNKDQMILVYCRSGNRSKQASEKLVKLGYTNIYEFGGINDWTGETVGEK
ncbi:MAG: rhodanese-like domain-containing protein [Lachnospiraceae bacterium]|nr:rhodanese-like domain-containing protein [Lachnospiraceae bacterium]